MKNTFKILLVMIMLLAVVFTLWACNDDEEVLTSLPTPVNLGASGSTISWSAVDNASAYELIVSNGEPITTTNTYYNLDISEIGTYLIKVRALGTNSAGEKIYSDYAEYTFIKSKKLATPVVNVDGKTVTWAAVENAQSYSVKVLDGDKNVKYSNDNQTELTLSLEGEEYTAVGKYTIQVKAIPEASKTEYANSDVGVNYYKVTQKLSTPSISNVSSTSIRWTSISGITSYQLKLFKVDGDSKTLKGTYSTTSNSYAFTYMDIADDGKYYCTVKAIGDGEIYLDSDESSRDKTYDLYVVPTIDEASLLLNDGVLSFTSQNVDMLSSFTVSLKTSKADGSSSMATIDKTIWVSDGDLTYTLAGGEYDEQRTYYNEMPAGYVKNTEGYDSTKTYYTFDGVTYTQATGSHSAFIEYFLKYDDIYYEAAKGAPTYTKVDTTTETFNTRYNYYKKTGENTYELIKSKYVSKGAFADLDSTDNTTKYFELTGTNEYTLLGTYQDIEDADKKGLSDYYVYTSFTSFTTYEDIEEYYKASYAEFGESDYTANTFYIITGANFSTNINDLFYTDNGGTYIYNRSDIAYYGRVFTITVDAQGIHNTVITGDSLTCDKTYISFRFPNKIDKDVAYADSPLKGYFEDAEAYTAFVTAHDGYFAIESVGDLQYIAKATSENYVLLQDLDAQGYLWTPIPTFSGIFDGNNHMLSNFVYASTASKFSGLFEQLNGATIKNTYIVNASNEADPLLNVAGIAGQVISYCNIENSYVKASFDTAFYAAGLIGNFEDISSNPITANSTILNCQTEISIKNAVRPSGLVAGANYNPSYKLFVKNCISNGSIKVEDYYYSIGSFEALSKNKIGLDDNEEIYAQDGSSYKLLGEFKDRDNPEFKKEDGSYYTAYYKRLVPEYENIFAGGLIGYAAYAEISNSSAAVEINITAPQAVVCAGGLIGYVDDCTITSSFAGPKYSRDAAKVMTLLASGSEAAPTTAAVGGFAGFVLNTTITDCYSTIKVSARDYFGGFVGVAADDITFTRCYATGGVSEQTATHKGLFYGYIGDETGVTFDSVYVLDKNLPVLPHVMAVSSLNSIYEAFKTSNTVAKIEGFNDQPCEVGAVYAESYEEEHKTAEDLKSKAYLALYNSSDDKVEVLDMTSSEEVLEIKIGDNLSKGTMLWVLQLKVDENSDGIDDGTGQRVVIFVTVT